MCAYILFIIKNLLEAATNIYCNNGITLSHTHAILNIVKLFSILKIEAFILSVSDVYLRKHSAYSGEAERGPSIVENDFYPCNKGIEWQSSLPRHLLMTNTKWQIRVGACSCWDATRWIEELHNPEPISSRPQRKG